MEAQPKTFQVWMITPEGRFLVSQKSRRFLGRKQSEFTEEEAIKLRDELRVKARGKKQAYYTQPNSE